MDTTGIDGLSPSAQKARPFVNGSRASACSAPGSWLVVGALAGDSPSSAGA
jgi:hypothetical protein